MMGQIYEEKNKIKKALLSYGQIIADHHADFSKYKDQAQARINKLNKQGDIQQ